LWLTKNECRKRDAWDRGSYGRNKRTTIGKGWMSIGGIFHIRILGGAENVLGDPDCLKLKRNSMEKRDLGKRVGTRRREMILAGPGTRFSPGNA